MHIPFCGLFLKVFRFHVRFWRRRLIGLVNPSKQRTNFRVQMLFLQGHSLMGEIYLFGKQLLVLIVQQYKMQYRGYQKMQYRGNNKMQYRGYNKMQYRGYNKMQYRGYNKMQYRGYNKMQYCGYNKMQYRGYNKKSL